MTATAAPTTPRHEDKTTVPAPSDLLYGQLIRLPLSQLHESPHNPRQRYDQAALDELADSFLQTGQLTPIIVRPRKAGGFEIAAGHRRYRAAKLAVAKSPEGAKHRRVDLLEAKVVDLDDRAFIEVLNVENLQRDDLHPLEEAQGFKDLMTQAGYDVAKIAARVGRSPQYVYDRIKLLQLTPAAKKLFLAGAFEAGHAIILARLTPEQQARAIGDLKEVAAGGYGNGDSLLLRPDTAAEDQDELPLHDRVKPVSVREFQHAIQREIRATPETVDPFLFPDSAKALEAAKEEKLSVIHITREYLASDEVRQADKNTRVYGIGAWERADGKPDVDQFGDRTAKSKPCDWSRYGFVASGPGQGEVFRVCINKDKCKVHWPEHVKKREQAKQRAKKQTKAREAGPEAVAKEEAREAAEDAKREREAKRQQRVAGVVNRLIAERAAQWAGAVLVIAKQIRWPGGVGSWLVRRRWFESDLDNAWYDVEHAELAFNAMRPKLGGGWSKRGSPATAAAQPVALAMLFWLHNELPRISDQLADEAERLVKAEEAAEAAKAKTEKKPATKGKKAKAKK